VALNLNWNHEQKGRNRFSLGAANSRKCDGCMCDKCLEVDRRIGLLKKMIEHLADPGTIEAANKLIEQMEATKPLHPEPEE